MSSSDIRYRMVARPSAADKGSETVA